MTNPIKINKKRLIVIANLIHASPRMPGLLAPLARKGWDITIVTPPLPENSQEALGFPEGFLDLVTISEVDYPGDVFAWLRNIMSRTGFDTGNSLTEQLKGSQDNGHWRRKFVDFLMIAYQFFMAYPDTERTWIKHAVKFTSQLLKTEQSAVLLSSAPMASSHIIAQRIMKKHGNKISSWVADFRDTWTQNPAYPFPWFRRIFEQRLEISTLLLSSNIVTVSDAYADNLKKIHSAPVFTIPNGYSFEPEAFSHVKVQPKFVISYTGTIYPKFQDTRKILDAIYGLKAENRLIRSFQLRFYGRYDSELAKNIRDRSLDNEVVQLGYLSRIAAVEAQRESQMLLFLRWENKQQRGLSHLKLYEYLSSNRPILAVGGYTGDEASQIIEEANAGYCGVTVEEIKSNLILGFKEFESNGNISSKASLDIVRRYSYDERSGELERVFLNGVL